MPAAAPPTVLTLPGLHGSGPDHWQSHWERRRPRVQRVEQESWTAPELGRWAAALERAVRAAPGPVVLAAHSLGCALVAHWSRTGRGTDRVRGALLVAPADVDVLAPLLGLRSFAPMPHEELPFAACVVASDDDPFVSLERAQAFARAWGARLENAGPRGHINVESGHGPWPEGERYLEALLAPGGPSAGARGEQPRGDASDQ